MNVVADTHAWLWWITRVGPLSDRAKSQLELADFVFVPAICLWEVGMLVEKGRASFESGLRAFFSEGIVPGRIEIAPITQAIAARSSEFGSTLHGDPADRLIAATAMELSCPLVTRDARLTGVPGLPTIW